MKKDFEKLIIERAKKEINHPLYQISDKLAKPVISLYLMQNDLKEITDCLRLTQDFINKNETILASLWKNIIVTYGKIFTKSDDGYSSLEKMDCIKPDQIELHEKIMSLRNSFIAHRGDNDIENSVLLIHEIREDNKISFEFTLPTAIQIGHPVKELEDVKNLIACLEQIVDEKLKKKLQGINSMLWKEMAKNGIVNITPSA